jgi:hypothetical protein
MICDFAFYWRSSRASRCDTLFAVESQMKAIKGMIAWLIENRRDQNLWYTDFTEKVDSHGFF